MSDYSINTLHCFPKDNNGKMSITFKTTSGHVIRASRDISVPWQKAYKIPQSKVMILRNALKNWIIGNLIACTTGLNKTF